MGSSAPSCILRLRKLESLRRREYSKARGILSGARLVAELTNRRG